MGLILLSTTDNGTTKISLKIAPVYHHLKVWSMFKQRTIYREFAGKQVRPAKQSLKKTLLVRQYGVEI